MRLFCIIFVAVISLLVAWIGLPYASNGDLLIAVVTIFSVFGGFLVAILSLSGDAFIVSKGSWRNLELNMDTAAHRMDRAQMLFHLYLLASVFVLIVLALHKVADGRLLMMKSVLEFLTLWLASMGVLFSFCLPGMLIGIQKVRIENEIERRRKAFSTPEELCRYKADSSSAREGDPG